MFTGIIEEVGTIGAVLNGGHSGELQIRCHTVLEGTHIGDSIAVNGVCLTVTRLNPDGFTADVMPETLRRSSLGQLRRGDTVNLERAMPSDGRFGGHIVSGHIDGTGTVLSLQQEQNAVLIRIRADHAILALIVEKGSIAIDGISLTVASLDSDSFTVSIIPHTASQTTLLRRHPGDTVNLENDIIGKYVRRLLTPAESSPPSSSGRITESFLAEHGFL